MNEQEKRNSLAAHSLNDWFQSVLAACDSSIFSMASNPDHRNAIILHVLTRNSKQIVNGTLDSEGELYTPLCFTLAASCRRIGLEPSIENWIAAIDNVMDFGPRHENIDSSQIGFPLGTTASIFKNLLDESLINSGVTDHPTILDEKNRKAALGLAINWGVRFLIAYALETNPRKDNSSEMPKNLSWIHNMLLSATEDESIETSFAPIDEIIPRDLDNPPLERLLSYFSRSIDKSVDFGSNLLKWHLEIPGEEGKDLPLILSLRHLLDLLDSVSLLVKHGSADACKILLRGTLESFLSLNYMLDSETENRCRAFMVCHFHKSQKFYKKIGGSSQETKQLKSTIKADKVLGGEYCLPDIDGLGEAISNVDVLLDKSEYKEVAHEYERMVDSGSRNPHWYSLFGGPKNLEQLARRLGRSALYEFLYRFWSGPIHGTDIIHGKIGADDDGYAQVVQIRYPKDSQSVTQWALNISFMTYNLYLENLIPDKLSLYKEFYLSMRSSYLRICGEPLIRTE